MRDIGREIGCSRSAVAHAIVRLGRQAISCHCALVAGLQFSGSFVFDGLVSAVVSRDYPSQITTLVEPATEMILAMTHCVTERGGRRTAAQRRRITRKRLVWRPRVRALRDAIALLVKEIPGFASFHRIVLDIDMNPLYTRVIFADLAMRWFASHRLLVLRRTPGSAPRTVANRLFAVNYVDRMIRHRVKEHTRESIALGKNSTMQMYRMWIFAWDHNVRQPHRVVSPDQRSRALRAGASERLVTRLTRHFATRRVSLRSTVVPESMRQVWLGQLDTPPVRWKSGQRASGPTVPGYVKLDLSLANQQGP
jgi:hypothetical protein